MDYYLSRTITSVTFAAVNEPVKIFGIVLLTGGAIWLINNLLPRRDREDPKSLKQLLRNGLTFGLGFLGLAYLLKGLQGEAEHVTLTGASFMFGLGFAIGVYVLMEKGNE